jgi:hypothetical protein
MNAYVVFVVVNLLGRIVGQLEYAHQKTYSSFDVFSMVSLLFIYPAMAAIAQWWHNKQT